MRDLLRLINFAQNGGNSESLLRQMAGSNPVIAQALKIVDGKTPEEINRIAANMAKERGTTVDAIKQQLMGLRR